ncbi:MAG TPA: rhamnogalacturonan acetylesterase [Tepidisphaeraceae bacterium]|jgi:lysophospholipase L1-like esterase
MIVRTMIVVLSCVFLQSAARGDTFALEDGEGVYSPQRGHGFDLGSKPVMAKGFVTAKEPFYFSVAAAEGNWRITVTLGGDGASDTTVKAESRRLMLESVRVSPGQVVQRSFVVNVRRPDLPDGGRVRLKARERDYLHWDDKLTLEFSGPHPAVRTVEVSPAPPETITVYLAGDSTVTDQSSEPYNSWGQMLPRFFKPTVAVANHAESGESLKSFSGAKRIDKILSTIKAGDYLFVQFGHNDQKDKTPGAGAFTTYADSLRKYVAEARRRGATPVLITPVSRRSFGPDGKIVNNLGDFPEAVRRVAAEEKVPLIDLNAMSHRFYQAMGPEESKRAFAPGDNTHHDNYGSYELAKCVVEGIRQAKLGLANELAEDVGSFDPARPDPIDRFDVPASPMKKANRPE